MIRIDALPEGTTYLDEGCDLAPSCLRCPFEVCKYDLPSGTIQLRAVDRGQQIRAMRAEGVSVDETARSLGVSQRTVFRLTKRQRL